MYWNNEKGSALFVVFMVTMVTFILGSALLTIATMEKKISINQTDEMKALNIAEAGIDMAIGQLKKDTMWRQGFSNITIGEGTLEYVNATLVSQVDSLLTIDLVSKGKVKGTEKVLDVRVEVQLPPLLSFGDGVSVGSTNGELLTINGNSEIKANFSYKGDIELSGSMKIIGRLYSEGNITVANSAYVDVTGAKLWANGNLTNTGTIIGDVYIRGNVKNSQNSSKIQGNVFTNGTVTNSGIITGSIYKGGVGQLQIPLMPAFSKEWLRQAADQPILTTTTMVLSPTVPLNNRIIFVDGDLNLEGTYKGRGTIVTTGTLTFSDDILRSNTAGDALAIISFGDIVTTGNKKIEALIMCDQTFDAGGNVIVGGALIARHLDINGGMEINFNEGLTSEPPPGIPATIKVVSWQEKYN